MAVTALPAIQTKITGDGLTPIDIYTSFTLTEKLEATRYIKDSDGKVEIDYSFIDTVKTLMFNSASTYTIEITTTSSDATPIVTVMPIEVTGMFRLDLTSAFRTLVSAIKISTSSTTNISVDVRIYGV